MRLLSFERDGRATFGARVGARVVDLGASYPDIVTALREDALTGLAETAAKAEPDLALADIVFRPVLGPPAKIICIGLNYMNHVREMNRKVPTVPSLFIKYHDAMAGHGQPVICPRISGDFDFEGELAVVIGKPGRYIAQDRAMDHVAGYTIVNDGSIRDWQAHNVCAGKNFPNTSGFGPYFVTADEIPDPHALGVTTRLNGAVVQDGNTADFIFSIPCLIEYVSSFTPLAPGDVISTGTPHGVGHGRTPPLYMKPGDVIEVEIDGLGTLINPVEQEA